MTSSTHIIWTLMLVVLFVGIVVWAWSGRRQTDFEEAAQLPLDNDVPMQKRTRGKNNHG